MSKKQQKLRPLSNKEKRAQLAKAKARKAERACEQAKTIAKHAESRKIYTKLSASRKLTRNTKDTIKQIFSGKFSTNSLQGPVKYSYQYNTRIHEQLPIPQNHRLWKVIQLYKKVKANEQQSNAAKNLVLALENNRSKLLEKVGDSAVSYINAIFHLSQHYTNWIRTPDSWKCRSKNIEKQFSSLLRHLFGKYDVPFFMDKVWFSPNSVERNWWLWLTNGNNIRKAANLPIPLTKKMAHHFLQAPDSYTAKEAFRWGQVHALGGNERNVEGVLTTSLRSDFSNNDFWTSVIRFLIANPMLDTLQYNPICDYLRNQKFIAPRGETPPQPNLSMHGRTADALLSHVETWHKRLGRFSTRRKGDKSWDHHPEIVDLVHQEKKKQGDSYIEINYAITQLLSTSELKTEGRKLEHCVGSYSWSCTRGQKSIWSLRRVSSTGCTLLGTIEVASQARRICQFKAKRNSVPSAKARSLLEKWAKLNKLAISRWV